MPDENLLSNRRKISYLANYPLLFEFIDLPQDDLNNLYSEFSRVTDEFLIKNYSRIYKNRQIYLIDSLQYKVLSLINKGGNYFGELVKFHLADLNFTAQGQNLEGIFFKYLGNKPIRYNHHEYMMFFSIREGCIQHVNREQQQCENFNPVCFSFHNEFV